MIFPSMFNSSILSLSNTAASLNRVKGMLPVVVEQSGRGESGF
jgi:hypothetical protein